MSKSSNPFGSAGAGTPTGGPDVSKLKEELTREETSQLNVEIPKSLHKQLKLHCLETEQEIRSVVRHLLIEYLST